MNLREMIEELRQRATTNKVAAAKVQQGGQYVAFHWGKENAFDEVLNLLTKRDSITDANLKSLEEANEALKPFAEAAENCDDDDKDVWHTWEHPVGMDVSIGDYRRAQAVYKMLMLNLENNENNG